MSIVAAFASLAGCATMCRAQPSGSKFEPYCGVYSVYAAARLNDKQVDLKSLLKPRYVGTFDGSSLEELRAAAIDCGLYAEQMQNLTPAALRIIKCPAILHVKSTIASRRYNHWILFTEIRDAHLHFIDPLAGAADLTMGELTARWDGTALLVSKHPIDTGAVKRRSIAGLVGWVFFAAVLGVLGAFGRRWYPIQSLVSRRSRVRRSAGVLIVIVLLASGVGVGLGKFADGGLLSQDHVIQAIQAAHAADFIPKASRGDVKRLIRQPNVTFIDARLREDFETGHIEGAINVPVDSSPDQISLLLAPVAKQSKLVLYCQSETCPFAKVIAEKLLGLGYGNLVLYRGGWSDWSRSTVSTTGSSK